MARQSARRADLIAALNAQLRGFQAATDAVDEAVALRRSVNRTDLRCMDLLDQAGRLTAGQLAQAAGITTAGATGVIDRLERAGFARRTADPSDRRRVFVEPTPQAHQDAGELYGPLARAGQKVLQRYSDDELELIGDFLSRAREISEQHAARLRAGLKR